MGGLGRGMSMIEVLVQTTTFPKMVIIPVTCILKQVADGNVP
jgi:hypothetical protein